MRDSSDFFHDIWRTENLTDFHLAFLPLMKMINLDNYGFFLLQNGINYKNTYLISGYSDVNEICNELGESFNFNLKLQVRKHLIDDAGLSYFPTILPIKAIAKHNEEKAWKSIVFSYANTKIMNMEWGLFGLSEKPIEDLGELINIRLRELSFTISQLKTCLEKRVMKNEFAVTPKLTFRQMQVLKMSISYSYRKEVATALGISVVTVAKHLDRVAEVLGVDNRKEIIGAAMRCGILPIYDEFGEP